MRRVQFLEPSFPNDKGIGDVPEFSCQSTPSIIPAESHDRGNTPAALCGLSETVCLTNGVLMPCIGVGCYKLSQDDCYACVRTALSTGYRMIDTSPLYGNDEAVGRAIRDSGIARDEIFVVTKLPNSDHGIDDALASLDASLQSLCMHYVDLWLVHWPVKSVHLKTWQVLEKAYHEKRCRSIGVSNYLCEHLRELLAHCSVAPMVNQLEIHPFCARPDVLAMCTQHDIKVQASSPLMRGPPGASVIDSIANQYGKTVAQILLRWCLQKGCAPLPKSRSADRIVENAGVFDFTLLESDMTVLDALNKERCAHEMWDPAHWDFELVMGEGGKPKCQRVPKVCRVERHASSLKTWAEDDDEDGDEFPEMPTEETLEWHGLSEPWRPGAWESVSRIPGLMLLKDFLSSSDEPLVLKFIDMDAWTNNREVPPRKVQIYGPRRDGNIFRQSTASAHPCWAQAIGERILQALHAASELSLLANANKLQSHLTGLIFVNEYMQATQELAFHVDNAHMFDDVIIGISLGAACTFSFARGEEMENVFLPARSMYIMSGIARYDFRHGLRAGSLRGNRRVSLTYRTIKNEALRS